MVSQVKLECVIDLDNLFKLMLIKINAKAGHNILIGFTLQLHETQITEK